ncbi:MAG: hypothetical protein JKY37_27400 [Nannocystaceae bacterium]|nr:hypothetical protein [Nannocystaceae bacterium]
MFATTGNARADSVLATLDATIAPFTQAPPADQGAAGWVAQGLGGALGLVNAPMMFIDAAASQGVSAVLDALGLAGLFPPMPVATIGLSMHLGTPHTHVHPPSLIPPAPPIPLPSLGVAFLAGSASVLVGGVPALRAGDIGIGFTCGSLAPPFEIMTGASGVYFAGARVARFGMDITFHCNPVSAMGGFAIGMGVAGIVAGAAGAAAQASAGNAGAAIAQGIQTGLDAAAMAVSMLRGKDPAGPPGIGMLLGPPMGNVMAGGPPIPNVGALAQGKIYSALGRAMRSMRGALRRRTAPSDANGRACDGGEPVHVVTGANYNTHLDFASILGCFEWKRFTSSANNFERGVMGWSWRHTFESRLSIRLHQVIFEGFEGEEIVFPRLRETDEVSMHGYKLRRLSDDRFTVSHRRSGTIEFERHGRGSGVARLVCIHRDGNTVELKYDRHRRVESVVERTAVLGSKPATYLLRYDDGGQLREVWGSRFGEPTARLAQYHYDHAGHLVRAEDAGGVADVYTYDAVHRMVRATDRIGYTFGWEYDHHGRCIKTQGEDGLWHAEFEYEPGVTKMKIHDGSEYTFVYDEDGVITSVAGPCGSEKKRLRDPSGRVVAEVDVGGQRIDFIYDDDGGLIARRNHFGDSFPPSLDASGVPQTLIRRLPENTRSFLFGGALPKLDETQPDLERGRNPRGNVVYQRDARGHERRWTFDAVGNETSHTDRDGCLRRTQVIRWGPTGARIDALGHTTRYEHNPHQKITKVVDAGGSESNFVYDSRDRIVEVHRSGQLRERYSWDVGHRLVEKTDGQGAFLLLFERHPNGLPQRITRCDGGFCEYDYDRRGNTTKADTADHRVRRSFTEFDEVAVDDCDGRSVRHEYGWAGETTTAIAERFVFTRRRHGNTLVFAEPTGAQRTVQCGADGSVHIDHGNGTHEVQQYDSEGRVVARSCSRHRDRPLANSDAIVQEKPVAADHLPWNVRHQYTPEGDLIATDDTVRGNRRYTVDAAHRLVGVQSSVNTSVRFTYDAANNLTELATTGRLLVDTGNRLRSAAIEEFGYDERARLASRGGIKGSEVRYQYDAEDQLVRVDDADDAPWTATYDGLGRRVTFGRGNDKTRLWWDGDQLAAREGPDGAFRIFLYADRGSFVPLGFVDYDSVDAAPESGQSYSVFSDQVGLPQHIENDKGEVVWWCDQATPYGEVFVRPGNKIEYHLRFPGHIHDPDLRLHYNRFRDSDPCLGRYLQPDPMGVRGGINLYAYPANPLVSVDVLGLTSHDNPDNGPPRAEDGDARPRDENPNDGADAPPPRISREEAVQRAMEAAEAHRVKVTEDFEAGRLAGFEDPNENAPACVAAVVDVTRPNADPFVAHNDPKGTVADPGDFGDVLRPRVAEQQQRHTDGKDHFSEPATHAEVKALDAAIKAREAETGVPVTEADLGDFVQVPMWNRDGLPGDRAPGTPAACCGHCQNITAGADNQSGNATPFVRTEDGWQRVE